MVTVSYYRVSVPLPTDATLDLDTIMGRVEYYNSSQRLLIFDTYSEHIQRINICNLFSIFGKNAPRTISLMSLWKYRTCLNPMLK